MTQVKEDSQVLEKRVIKFRAWDMKSNVMREVIEMRFGGPFYDYMLSDPTPSAPKNWTLRKETECKALQFTGLHDKNGVEIYEGDIVKIFHGHPSWICTPFLINYQNYAFALKRPEKRGSTALATYLHDCVDKGVLEQDGDESALFLVIGNIYQNPELL